MFFSDDLLTGKKGSLGIVWLMATLGPRSKRVSRKEINNLEISRTCELIAQPPEPMALRLSGHLLVGVARVYHHSINMFYDECQTLEATLSRPSIFGGSSAQAKRGAGGLDMPGDGISRPEQITFPQIDLNEYLSHIDVEFAGIDWNNPLPNKRSRRATSKFSLQPSHLSQSQDRNDKVDEVDEIYSDEEDEDNLSPGKKRRLNPPRETVVRRTESVEPNFPHSREDHLDLPDEREEDGSGPIDLDILHDLDMFTDSTPSRIRDVNPDDNIEVTDVQPDIPDFNVVDQPPQEGNKGSPAPVEQEVAEPPKKKAKKVKTVTYDETMEVETHAHGTFDYIQMMLDQKQEINQKKEEHSAQVQATLLVDGWGLYMQFTDPDMTDFFSSIAKAPKFKWELDILAHKRGTRLQTEQLAQPRGWVEVSQRNEQPPDDLFPEYDPNNNQVDQFEIPDIPEPDPGRRQDRYETPQPQPGPVRYETPQPQPGPGSQPLPWSGMMSDGARWTGRTGGPRDAISSSNATPLVSMLTPRERFLRSTTDSGTRHRFRSPTGSLASVDPADLDKFQLINDKDADMDMEDDSDPDRRKGPFSPEKLALLELQCREFFSFVEVQMLRESTNEIHFHEILPSGSNRPIAAAAFHNCLALATKGIFHVSQDKHQGPIKIRLATE